MKLSVLVPSIRPQNLQALYESIKSAFSGDFEMVVIGPNGLPDTLKDTENVRYIEDWGSPIRAQQRGLVESVGQYITWAADDGVYLPASLDKSFELLGENDYKTVIMGKYREGDGDTDGMVQDWYYVLNNHTGSIVQFIPDNCLMLNCGLVSRDICMELGGWDAKSFQVCPYAYHDFSIRLQKYGCKFIIQEDVMFKCGHMPAFAGDHGPIHVGQTQFDEPLFKEIYNHPYFSKRLAIDLNNWQQAPERWNLRFGVA